MKEFSFLGELFNPFNPQSIHNSSMQTAFEILVKYNDIQHFNKSAFSALKLHKFEYFAVLFMLLLVAQMIPQSLYNPGTQLPYRMD